MTEKTKNTDVDRKSQIKERREELFVARERLKKHFIGLDDIIDKIFQNLEIWYALPQAINRPVIINLWGMTGVGKTDLVRKLVKEIGMLDKYMEIQLDMTERSSTIEEKLLSSSIDEGEPGILFLDEMQRFRTVDQNGNEMKDSGYKDIWMLLSDGKFSSSGSGKKDLIDKILDDLFWEDYKRANKSMHAQEEPADDGEERDEPVERKYNRGVYSARQLKRTFKLKESIEELMKWSNDQRLEMINDKIADPNFSEGSDFSKLLIFISGNIDEAYSMSHMCGDADIDADTLHGFSKRISVINIKDALMRRFKPEQISRMGNTHVIYPSFSQKNFEDIIQMRVDLVKREIFESTGVNIEVDKSINDKVYSNGVFPAQGVRPVFSSVGSIFETNMPVFLIAAIERGITYIKIKVNEDNRIESVIDGDKIISEEIQLDLDTIRDKFNIDEKALTSVHESGHAVLYSLLTGFAPRQVKSVVVTSNAYVFPHKSCLSRISILDKIKILFAGRVAEEMLFNRDDVTAGASHDIEAATAYAAQYVRAYGLDGYMAKLSSETAQDSAFTLNCLKETDPLVKEMLETEYQKCQDIMQKNQMFLKKVITTLNEKGELDTDGFCEVAKEFVPNIKTLDSEEIIYAEYGKKMKKNLKKIK